MNLLRFDPSGLFRGLRGVRPTDIHAYAPIAEAIRDELVRESWICTSKTVTSPPPMSFSGTVLALPEIMASHYERFRSGSVLGRMFRAANRIFSQVDTMVVLGSYAETSAPRAIMQACAHPNHNELTRAHRGSKPRLYFDGDMLDNDASNGLLERLQDLPRDHPATCRWGLCTYQSNQPAEEGLGIRVVYEKHWLESEQSQTHRANPRPLLLLHPAGTNPIPAPGGYVPLDTFEIPSATLGEFGAFTVTGILPIALIGVDCMQLLLGGMQVSRHFRAANFEDNIVLQFAAANRLAREHLNIHQSLLGFWSKSLEGVGNWAAGLPSAAAACQAKAAQIHSYVLPRDLHRLINSSPSQGSLLHSIHVENDRTDPLLTESNRQHTSQCNQHLATWQTNGNLYTTLTLPNTDVCAVGQLMQLLMLATLVEQRWSMHNQSSISPPWRNFDDSDHLVRP